LSSVQTLDAPPTGTRPPRRGRHVLAWIGGVLAVLVLGVALFLAFFDWNAARGPIGRYASARTGRVVAIDGDLKVHLWSLTPGATVEGLRIGNPAWAGPGQTATVGKLAVKVKLLPLLVGHVVLPLLEFDRADVRLLRDKQGRTTWDFSNGKKAQEPLDLPPINRFIIDDGKLRFEDAKRKLVFSGAIAASEKQGSVNRGFNLTGDGALNGAKFTLKVTGGPLLNVDTSKPYPFDADIRAGATHVVAKGEIPKPFKLAVFSMDATAQGQDLSDLYDLTGVPLPNSPPYKLSGRLSRNGHLVKIEGLGGRVGDSDLAGDLSVDSSGERPFLKAVLRSKKLDFDDLATVFGGAPSITKGETASPEQVAIAAKLNAEHRLLPDATLKVDRLRAIDADVTYHAQSIDAPHLPLRGASAHVKLDNGLLVADPVSFALPQGSLAGSVKLNARGAIPVTDLDVRLSNARLEQMVPISGQPLTGALVGRARLHGTGDSVHRAFSNADGEMLLVVPGGEIRKAFAELLGINVTKGLGLLFAKDETTTPIRCAVAHFDAKSGVLQADQIVIDTGPVLATAKGSVDLGTERLDLRIEGHPKKFRLVRLTAPITIKGPIVAPKVGVEASRAVAQGGAAALLATVAAPLAVVLPFVDLGLAKDAACGALIAEAGRQGAPVKSAQR
jgi:uncharacterized protein involved in outer membrane biogenesis